MLELQQFVFLFVILSQVVIFAIIAKINTRIKNIVI